MTVKNFHDQISMKGPSPLWPKEKDGLLVAPGKTYMRLTDHLINCSGLSLPSDLSQTIHKLSWLRWVVIFKALFGCHDILILG